MSCCTRNQVCLKIENCGVARLVGGATGQCSNVLSLTFGFANGVISLSNPGPSAGTINITTQAGTTSTPIGVGTSFITDFVGANNIEICVGAGESANITYAINISERFLCI